MKKRVLPFLTGILSTLLLASCGKGPNFDSDTTSKSFDAKAYAYRDYIEITKLHENLSVGETKRIALNTLPEQYALNQIEYTSNDETVATVDELGNILGVSKGVTTIDVTSKDNEVSTRVLVSVSDPISGEDAAPIASAILGKYDAAHVFPNKYFKREYSEDYYVKNGKEQYSSKSFETMAYDATRGYLMIQSEDLIKRVEGGAYEKLSGKWIFYVKNQTSTRFIHVTPTAKTFIDISTGGYTDKSQVIVDILNMFFSSGEKFLNDDLSSFDGREDANTFLSDTNDDAMTYSTAGGNNLYYSCEEYGGGTISTLEELDYVDIPAGTTYNGRFKEDGIFQNDIQTAYSFEQGFSYQLGEDHWERHFNRSAYFESSFEREEFPSDPEELSELGFKLVETVSDL